MFLGNTHPKEFRDTAPLKRLLKNSVVCEMCACKKLGRKAEREMGGRKTDGEMDREKGNVAKWYR